MTTQKRHLIDVRTPAEFLTGHLHNAINIEYQDIYQLPSHIAGVSVSDSITLYCRSGRRSGIALETLKSLGYGNVRDIGGLEEARAVLKREEAQRTLPDAEERVVSGKEDEKKHAREKSLGALLEGLKGLDEE